MNTMGGPFVTTSKQPPRNFTEWIEFYWLQVVNPTFRRARDKRKAYFEHRLAKLYDMPCF